MVLTDYGSGAGAARGQASLEEEFLQERFDRARRRVEADPFQIFRWNRRRSIRRSMECLTRRQLARVLHLSLDGLDKLIHDPVRPLPHFRAGRRYWGTIGIMLGLGLVLMPMPQTTATISIPAPNQDRR